MGKIKDFFTKIALKKQLGHLPQQQQEMIMKAVQENPEFFENIAKEIENKKKHENKSEMEATMEVMRKYQGEMQKLIMGQK
jgi:tRNA-dihydrouridine synthase